MTDFNRSRPVWPDSFFVSHPLYMQEHMNIHAGQQPAESPRTSTIPALFGLIIASHQRPAGCRGKEAGLFFLITKKQDSDSVKATSSTSYKGRLSQLIQTAHHLTRSTSLSIFYFCKAKFTSKIWPLIRTVLVSKGELMVCFCGFQLLLGDSFNQN